MNAPPAAPADFASARPSVPLRRNQEEALAALEDAFAEGRRRAWVVLPPGLGKTLRLLRELPEATVIGLAATPPDRLTIAQAELVTELFGPAVQGPSIPAAVREGHLAPYAELAWLTAPTEYDERGRGEARAVSGRT